jgi:hypothetical protein
MAVSFAGKIVAGLLAVTLLRPDLMTARDTHLTVWENLRQLTAVQEIEVTTRDHKSVQGSFLALSDQSISLRRKQKEITIPRPDVVRVRLHSSSGRTHMLIGAAIGGGAGAGVGAGIGESVSNGSGLDFNNLKPAIIGVCAGVGALVGLLIGSVVGGRHTIVYSVS